MEKKNEILVLLVDDNPQNLQTLATYLDSLDVSIALAQSGKEAIRVALRYRPDLILLDIIMPEMNGYQVLAELRENPLTRHISVIFITAHSSNSELSRGLEAGAVDYLTKPLNKIELLARVKTQIQIKKNRDIIRKQLSALQIKEQQLLEKERQRRELLNNLLPRQVLSNMERPNEPDTFSAFYSSATVLFTDFKAFTQSCIDLPAHVIVSHLDKYFSQFDEILKKYQIEKIKTIGDSYMAVGGIPEKNSSHALETTLAAMEFMKYIEQNKYNNEYNMPVWDMRIGINTGPLIAGIIGKSKYSYDVWGETVNLAHKIEDQGCAGKIWVSESTFEKVGEYFDFSEKYITEPARLRCYQLEKIKPSYAKDKTGNSPNAKLLTELNQ